jgi:hypothetical protein
MDAEPKGEPIKTPYAQLLTVGPQHYRVAAVYEVPMRCLAVFRPHIPRNIAIAAVLSPRRDLVHVIVQYIAARSGCGIYLTWTMTEEKANALMLDKNRTLFSDWCQ